MCDCIEIACLSQLIDSDDQKGGRERGRRERGCDDDDDGDFQ